MTLMALISADFLSLFKMYTCQHEAGESKMATYIHSELTREMIGCFYHVYNHLGYGFLEKVYENALCHELRKHGLVVGQQTPIVVWYDGLKVGEYYADLLVDDKVLLELKAISHLTDEHSAQLLNYLKATGREVGLLLNFGSKPEVRRQIFQTARVIAATT
jgi:GxxExxY protein